MLIIFMLSLAPVDIWIFGKWESSVLNLGFGKGDLGRGFGRGIRIRIWGSATWDLGFGIWERAKTGLRSYLVDHVYFGEM